VITDSDVKEKLAAVFTEFSRKAWAGFPSERTRYLGLRGGTWYKSKMSKIPILIAVCYEPQGKVREELIVSSVWASIENMLLAATSDGLGSCIYTFYSGEEEERVKTILRVPKQNRIAAVIQLGFAATIPPAPSRKALEEIVSYEHF
jgi:nitroreductase